MTFMQRPIVKATVQAAGLSALSNVLAQMIAAYRTGNHLSIDFVPVFQFLIFTIVSTPPNFLWQQYLEQTFPAHPPPPHPKKSDEKPPPPKLSVRNTIIKLVLDQSVGAVVNTLLFSTFINALQEAMAPAPRITSIFKAVTYWTNAGAMDFSKVDFEEVWGRALHDLMPIMKAGWKLWPLVGLVNFTMIKTVEARGLVGALAGVGWGIYMSMVAAK